MTRATVFFISLLLLVSLAFAGNDIPVKADNRPYQIKSDASGITLEFDDLDVTWETMESGGEMPVLYGAGEVGVAGAPSLPVYNELLAVPDGMRLVLRAVRANWRDLGERELAHYTGQEYDAGRDEEQYSRIAQEFEQTVVVGETHRWRDLRIAQVTIRPMKMVTGTGHVLLAEDLEVDFGFEPVGFEEDTYDPPGVSEALLPLYEEYIGNALDYIDYGEVTRGTYLMIYPPAWEESVEILAEWRTKCGFNVMMASTTETGNSFTSIYNYIRGVYDSADPPLEYVNLLGDMDDYPNIACEYIEPGVIFPIDPQIATDQKYTYDLDGSSDYENVLPDYLIGRVSVDTEYELRTMINKILQYETTPFVGDPNRYLRAVTIANSSSAVSTRLTQDWVRWKMETLHL